MIFLFEKMMFFIYFLIKYNYINNKIQINSNEFLKKLDNKLSTIILNKNLMEEIMSKTGRKFDKKFKEEVNMLYLNFKNL